MTAMPTDETARKSNQYYPWWLDNLADDVTGEGAAMQGVVQGAENVRNVVTEARKVYQNQEFHFTGDYGSKGYLEEYTCEIEGQPTRVVVTVTRNTEGKCQHLVEIRRHASGKVLHHR